MRSGAIAILTAISLTFVGWLGSNAHENSKTVERHSAEIKSLHYQDDQQLEMLKEMRQDIKTLIRRRN